MSAPTHTPIVADLRGWPATATQQRKMQDKAADTIDALLAALEDALADNCRRKNAYGEAAIAMSASTERKARAAITKARGDVK